MGNMLMMLEGLQNPAVEVNRVHQRPAHAAPCEMPPMTAMYEKVAVWNSRNR